MPHTCPHYQLAIPISSVPPSLHNSPLQTLRVRHQPHRQIHELGRWRWLPSLLLFAVVGKVLSGLFLACKKTMRSALPTPGKMGSLTPAKSARLGNLLRRCRTVPRRGSGLTLTVSMSAGSRSKEVPSSGDRAPPRAVTADHRARFPDEVPRRAKKNDPEELLEKIIFKFRFFTLLGVSGSLVGSMLCFFKGCVLIASSFLHYLSYRGKVVQMLIEAIDVYLLGTVMLVFGMGLYELFISNLDIGKTSSSRSNLFGLFTLQERPKWLEIKSVNELKTKLGHVIVMVLLVGLFEKSTKVVITSPVDLLYFAASILFSSSGLYFLFKLK